MPGHVNKRNNAILRVADVVDLKAEVIEVFGEGRFEPSHAVMSAVGGALQPSISRVPDEVGREEGERSIDSFRAKGLESISHKLHVLLRHRLLREAEIGECVLALVVKDHLGHFVAAHVTERCALRMHFNDLQTAVLSAPALALEDEDSLV